MFLKTVHIKTTSFPVLVFLGCFNKNAIDWVAYKKQIYFLVWRLGSPRWRCQQIWVSSSFSEGRLLIETSNRVEKEEACYFMSTFIKTLVRMPPSWLKYLPEALPSGTFALGIKVPAYEFRRENINIQFIIFPHPPFLNAP